MGNIIRVAVDAMGGDDAPRVVVEGSVQALQQENLHILLVGTVSMINSELSKYKFDASRLTVVASPQVIGMEEHPVASCKEKPESSIMVCARLVKEGRADAFFSAGNTGAVVVSSLFTLGKLEGIDRPAIGVMLPTLKGFFLLVDGGATVDCKPKNLLQFAMMGSVLMEYVYGYKKPRVGLLSVGSEPTKGNELTVAAHELIQQSKLNFIGNIEGNDIVGNKVDVLVCDGFVGNIVLKFAENLFRAAELLVRREFVRQRIVPSVFQEAFENFRKRVDYAEYGGMPLLGVNGVCVIGHGRSSPKAIKNAIRVASESVSHSLNRNTIEYFKREVLGPGKESRT
ncbi:phosphate--acyl-ACP acyltransferase [Candidatus Desantisbacteria bacterium CG_4_10_14_0_8_um_filter_48_22]|uniref:Phosphate acyltransferase n=1 Tax=Candidatus Desantisbacteria bacterium CG_4_10_14_0_8_um_filter_48_22 TaxID=1974543 RepID=A0A2M7SEZ8_9BACT|nr:MAG: phosphate--acyl-ACP acyltransferase [Candidatus Desantisbacteria bacterium CG_4_10_14_0_8_um_filter_48_22]